VIKPVQHELKTWPEGFAAIVEGRKRHEVRRWDRDYRVGDELILREWDPTTESYTGAFWTVRIEHISKPSTWGLPDDVGVMSIRPYRDRWAVFGEPEARESNG
jgi:hypothetical protein